jgi:hypothetical protein
LTICKVLTTTPRTHHTKRGNALSHIVARHISGVIPSYAIGRRIRRTTTTLAKSVQE